MIQQWVYAYSCWNRPKRVGGTAGTGFGTYSWTDGLAMEDIEELERRCRTYKVPSGLPSRLDAAALAELPLAVQSFRLASGKRAIVRTVFVGEGFWDHRWGAILSHAMVKESGDWEGYPAEWMDSESFWKELPAEVQAKALEYRDAKSRGEPPPLPALEDEAFARSGHYSTEQVAEHFRDKEAREALVRLASLWAESEERPGNVMFVDGGKDAPWLVAGFSMLFPVWVAQDVSWATRLFSGSVPEECRERWYEVAGADSRVPCAKLKYAEANPEVEEWVSTVERERREYFGFLEELPQAMARDWRMMLRLYRLVRGREEIGVLDECLEFVRTSGTPKAKRWVLEELERRPELLPQPLEKAWMDGLLAACGDGEENDRICARLLLAWRRRFESGGAEKCFLDWLRQGVGDIGAQWLAGEAARDGSTQGLEFTVAAAAHGALDGGANAAVEASLERVAPAPGADWGAVLAFTERNDRGALAAVLDKCPDSEAVAGWVQRTVTDAEGLASLVEELRGVEGASGNRAARRVVAAYCGGRRGDGARGFRDVFRVLEKRDASLAGDAYAAAYRWGAPGVETAEDLTWFAEKIAWVSEDERAEYWRSVDRSLPAGRAGEKALRGALESFWAQKPAGEGPGRAGFLLWTRDVEQAPAEAVGRSRETGLAASFAELPEAARGEWTSILLPKLFETIPRELGEGGRMPDATQGAMAHGQLLGFFSVGLGAEGLRLLGASYASLAVQTLRRRGQCRPTEQFRFGTLVRWALGESGVLAETVRVELLKRVYLKERFTLEALEAERKALALAHLSSDEKRGWESWQKEYEALRKTNGWLTRIAQWFSG